MPIGRFSKSCRLTIKALRHYDDIGLLKPTHVDTDTGYRYYTKSQAKEAIKIGMLRSLKIPIPIIREILSSKEEQIRPLLIKEQAKIQSELEDKQRILNSLRRLSVNEQLMPYKIKIRHEPAYVVAHATNVTNIENLLKDSTELIYKVFKELQSVGRGFEDPVMCINGDPDKRDNILIQACIGLTTPYPQLNNINITEIEGGMVACLLHKGPYEELGLAYHSLFSWIQEHGYDQNGEMREIYKNDPTEVPVEELRTEVILPIKTF